jgi:glycerol uptake facilitator-like aquaporin
LNETDEDGQGQAAQIKKDTSLLSLFWTLAFGSSLAMTAPITSGSLNPAVGFAIEMTMLMDNGDRTDLWGDVFIYLLCPIAGGVCALAFYYLVYLKTKAE